MPFRIIFISSSFSFSNVGEGKMYNWPHQCCWALAEISWSPGQHLQQSADWCHQQWEWCHQQGQESADWRIWRRAWCGPPIQGEFKRPSCDVIISSIWPVCLPLASMLCMQLLQLFCSCPDDSFNLSKLVQSRPTERAGWWSETRTMEKVPAESMLP